MVLHTGVAGGIRLPHPVVVDDFRTGGRHRVADGRRDGAVAVDPRGGNPSGRGAQTAIITACFFSSRGILQTIRPETEQ